MKISKSKKKIVVDWGRDGQGGRVAMGEGRARYQPVGFGFHEGSAAGWGPNGARAP